MDVFDSTWYTTAVCITVAILIASTIYTVRNILKIWRIGKPLSSQSNDTSKEKEGTSEQTTDDELEEKDNTSLLEGGDAPEIDPMQYCEHIQSEVKKAKIRVAEKKIGETMTPEQVEEEKEVQRKQLEEIFRLMQEQNEKFGVNSVEDIQNQMKLYA